jgi:hypothetical protein
VTYATHQGEGSWVQSVELSVESRRGAWGLSAKTPKPRNRFARSAWRTRTGRCRFQTIQAHCSGDGPPHGASGHLIPLSLDKQLLAVSLQRTINRSLSPNADAGGFLRETLLIAGVPNVLTRRWRRAFVGRRDLAARFRPLRDVAMA